MDSSAVFLDREGFASVTSYCGQRRQPREPSHDFRRQAERAYRVCCLRLCGRDRAWHDL